MKDAIVLRTHQIGVGEDGGAELGDVVAGGLESGLPQLAEGAMSKRAGGGF